MGSKELTFVYIEDNKETWIDVEWSKIGKKKEYGRFISSELNLYGKTKWYKKKTLVYTIEEESESAFGFPIDFENMAFGVGNENSKEINNEGYDQAPFHILLSGPIINPCIRIKKNGQIVNSLSLNIELTEFEKFEYCTRDDLLLLRKINEDGTTTNLFEEIDDNNTNFFKLPLGISNLEIVAKTDIKNARITVYLQYE